MARRMIELARDMRYVAECLTTLDKIMRLPSCQDCTRECEYRVKWGELVRFNCPLHENNKSKEDAVK